MSNTKAWQSWYKYVLVVFFLIITSVIANTKAYNFIGNSTTELFNSIKEISTFSKSNDVDVSTKTITTTFEPLMKTAAASPMFFTTIVANADETETCSNDGATLARFNLCGSFDDRIIALDNVYSTYEWQRLDESSCSDFDIDLECPTYTCGSSWVDAGSGSSLTLDASSITSGVGAEYRVRVDGGSYYYIKVKKSSISQTYVKTDYICGELGRIQITNLSSSYEYAIDDGTGFGAWQGAIFEDLLPGTYTVKARLKNTDNTCEYPYEPIEIETKDIDVDVTFVDANCYGENGSISVQVNNVPGPYKYTLLDSDGAAQEFSSFIASDTYDFAAVGFGTYSIQVDTQQCSDVESVDVNGDTIVIGEGLVALSASTEVNSSFGCADITSVDVKVNTSGGAAPFTYTVNGGSTVSSSYTDESTYTVTSPGDYSFLITDANGCTITASATVQELSPPDVTASGIDGTCTNGGAKINFTVNNANGYNLSYRVSSTDSWVSTTQISVTDGTYDELEVQYEQGGFSCTIVLPSVTVTSDATISGSATKIADETCDGSGGTVEGSIEFSPASGGSGTSYEYSIDGVNFQSTLLFSNLSSGTYTPVIIDDSGCRLELTAIEIEEADPPTNLDFTQSNINCALGTTDVELTATANSTIANYSIISPTTIDNGTNNNFTGLSTTTSYIFQITDANGCIYTEGFTPVVISSIRAREKSGGDKRVCNGETDGSGTFIIDGFATSYTYQINSEAVSAVQTDSEIDLTSRGAGTYIITVTDTDTGCTDTAEITIEEASLITLSPTVTAMSCDNNNTGRVIASASGGWGSYSYSLTYPDGSVDGPQSNVTFSNLTDESTPGSPYILTVEDSEGCTETFEFQLTALSSPTISISSSNLCYEPVAGASVTVDATGGDSSSGYEYRINGGTYQSSGSFSNLSPGTHTFQVSDVNGCTDEISVTINPQLRVSTSIETEIPCGGSPGEILVELSGGYLSLTTPKEYQVSVDGGAYSSLTTVPSDSFTYEVVAGGTYVFRVTDNEGCEAYSEELIVEDPDNIEATDEVITASCGDPDSGGVVITPTASSGVPPFEIDFDGAGFTSQTVYTGLTSGVTYNYTVRDSRGCLTVGKSVTITDNPNGAPDANVSALEASCSVAGEEVSGSIIINSVADGTPDFTYVISDAYGNEIITVGPTSSTSETITDSSLVPGTYTVRTVDASGCTDEDTVTIGQTTLTVVPDPVTPACNASGFSNTVTIIGGDAAEDFLIRLTTDTSSPVVPNIPPRQHTFDNLEYGVTYTVEVTDVGAGGCIYYIEIPPQDADSPLNITATSPVAFCDDSGNGRTDFTVSDFSGDITIDLIDPITGAILQTDTADTATVGTDYDGFFEIVPDRYTVRVTDSDTCTDATIIDVILNIPSIDIISNIPANCNAQGQLTVRGSGGDGGPYQYAFVPAGTTPDKDGTLTPSDTSDDFSSATTAVLDGSLSGTAYDIYVIDGRGCTFNVTESVILLQPELPEPTIVVDNQCDATASAFDITASLPDWVNSPTFTLNGESKTGVFNTTTNLWEVSYTVSTPGDYTVEVIDANGCFGSGIGTVYEYLTGTAEFSTMPSCNNDDGVITVSPNGGSGNFSFELFDDSSASLGSNTTGVFDDQTPGDYEILITDNEVTDGVVNCQYTVNVSLEDATPPIIEEEIKEDITCNGADNGSITIVLQAGSDVDNPIEYILTNLDDSSTTTNSTGTFDNLSEADYQVEVVTDRGCSVTSSVFEIIEPVPFLIEATNTDFACEVGANRFSSATITVDLATVSGVVQEGTVGSGYQYSITGYENYQTSNTFEIIDDGTTQNITVYAIDGNGCRDEFDVVIAPPSEVQGAIAVQSVLNCEDDEVVRITVVGTSDFTVQTTSATAVADVTNSGSNDYVDINLPVSGEYLFVVQDNVTGCLYPLPRHDVVDPISPIATISEATPIQCFGDNNGELFIEVSDYDGEYEYNVYESTDTSQTTSLATGIFNTANYPDVLGDEARISGLEGGNYFVTVRAIDNPKCTDISNVTNIRTPNGVLSVSTVEIDNVSCTDDTGKIVATGVGGWDSSPYEYRLLMQDATGTIAIGSETYVELVAYGSANEFTDLSSGDYIVEIKDVEECSSSSAITLNPIDPIVAEIRETQELVCPDGNDAILESFDPASGDSDTGVAGASGGVPGAGYKYQLLYLNSNDNTDIASTSGLQDSPTFDGMTSGFISAGWYAIEVSSSYNCVTVTEPYYVEPPTPIDPKLVQVTAPGCGGDGQIQLSVENPEAGFSYEYRLTSAADTDPFIQMVGTSVLIDATIGFYQYDVRKVGDSGVCKSLSSEGITLVDAQDIDLVANLPDDISCASETDGRIESFSSGGVGAEMYTLYLGNPTPSAAYTAFSPDPAATVVMGPQSDGTFEGLDEGEYYITVTSGTTCYDVEGPLVIERPEPIVYNITTTNISCNGEENGTITIEVLSGGEGLVQFSINPNFNEFFIDSDNPNIYTFENLDAGSDYEILIQDEQGCGEFVMVDPITEPEVLSISTVVTQPEICLDAFDGEVQFAITGGTPFEDVLGISYYETKIEGEGFPEIDPSDITEGFTRNDDLLFTNLQGGEWYHLYVRDQNGCVDETFFEIELGVDLTAEAIPEYGCEGIFPNSTVNVEMADSSVVSDLMYSLDVDDITLATSQSTFGDLPAGDHIVYIYHSNGCMTQVDFTIEEYDPLSLTVTKTAANEITAVAEGGYGNYDYSFQGISTGSVNTFEVFMDTDIMVQVEDEKGCFVTVTIPFDFDTVPEFPNFFTPDGDNNNDTWEPNNREYFPYIEVKIYDRYGRVVAVLNQITSWDGTYEGNDLPSGDYWYVVNANDEDKQQYVGHFTLYR
ncbi:T9SS type B sorting domain-containing protein [Cellulophaga baltica]|uniref:T9SS type B sorting domain-containing protein n=1 Tax=Cellulophaga TaxID=104264 RepID=UPI001C06F3B9|nr:MULTISPECIES: T9SS type B sorting domain-containing protein [Cellulophaga]MBU2996478.1 T9SS type B sorting domain-containing protein [Cellulophaga baltica]MDO6767872.1 T9SS type B sorting domain-containing protein [Cellulophaga sp. 1_MG-2023]